MGQFDSMSAPPRRPLFGAIADVLGKVNEYANKPDPTMPGGLANPPLSTIANALALPSLAKTADRISYGEPLTNQGKANVPFFRPETVDAAMAVAPLAGPMLRGTSKAATGASNALVRGITGNPEATAGRVIDYAQNMLPGNAATVWHGSPHKFSAFDASKIGTGEGAQAFGHGLYVAESPGVAQSYKDAMSGLQTLAGSSKAGKGDVASRLSQMFGGMGDEWTRNNRSIDGIAAKLAKSFDEVDGAKVSTFNDGSKFINNGNWWDVASPSWSPEGYMYKIDLQDQAIPKMLDWDNGGAKIWADAIKQHGSPSKAADALRAQGIPGIRYLDGASRGSAGGSSNFVVFPGNEGLLSILERNGQPVR